MMSYVFISYSRHDKAYVESLAQALESRGLESWWDVSIEAGDRWWRTIEEAIEGCAAFIVIMSPEARESDWVEREIMIAQRGDKPIIPLLRNGREFGMLINVQFHDVSDGGLPGEDVFRKLADIVHNELIPEALLYSDQHIWVREDQDRRFGTLGLTHFGQEKLGVIVGVELSPLGTDLQIGVRFASVDTKKAKSDLISPVEGKIHATNPRFEETPSYVNTEPYRHGWLVKVKGLSYGYRDLMDAKKYAAYCETLK